MQKEIYDKGLVPYSQALLNIDKPHSRFAEAYRTLRTNIHFADMGKVLKSIMITSTGQAEGKTITAYNLGLTISQTGKSVLMVDADLRKPMLTRLFNAKKAVGLTGILSDIFNTDIKTGELEKFNIHDVLQLIFLQKRTGLLRLSDDQEKVELHFINGKQVYIDWLTRPDKKKLANVLVENKIIPVEHAKAALRKRRDTGQKLGDILLNMGLINENDLKGPLNMHMLESFQVLSNMKSGKFNFTDFSESKSAGAENTLIDPYEMCRQVMGNDKSFIYLDNKIDSAIVKSEIPGLFVLPSGTIPPNPSELLGSERMFFLISYLKKKFDFIIFDTPPILPASDGLLIAPQTNGVALVVKAGHMRRNMVAKVVEQIHRTGANILGVILNRVDIKREGYYKYYQKYYTDYYSQAN